MMHRTDRVLSLEHPQNGRLGWSSAMAGGLAVLVIALVAMLVMRARWLDHAITHSHGPSAKWLPAALAAGVLLGGVSLLWLVLAHFAREVEGAPYVWLAPVVTALPSIAIVAWELTPPSGLPGRLFAVAWVPLLIGGGSLFRLFGLGHKTLGFLLWSLPAVWVLGNAVVHGSGSLTAGWYALPRNEQMFLAVVSVTCFGVGFLAFLTRDSAADARGLRDEQRQLARERLSIAEERATLADEREGLDGLVARAEAALGGHPGTLDEHELALVGDRKRTWWPLALAALVVVAGILAFEFEYRRPMLQQSATIRSLTAKHQEELSVLRGRLGSHDADALATTQIERDKASEQRDSMRAELEALRSEIALAKTRTAVAMAVEPAKAQGEAKPATSGTAEPTARASRRVARRATRFAAKARRKAAAKRARATRKARKKRAVSNAKNAAPPAAHRRANNAPGEPHDSVIPDSNDPLLGIDLK